MKLSLLLAGIISIALAPAQNADGVLAAMRAGLGGDALNDVKTFMIGGTVERRFGERTMTFTADLTCQLPDKCVRRTRQSGGMGGLATTIYEGFSGDDPVLRRDSSRRAPPAPNVPDPAVTTARFKGEFGRLQLVLFGSAPVTYPLQFASLGPRRFEGRAVDAIEVKHEEFTAKLLVDAVTHLPAVFAWTTPPMVLPRPLPDGPPYVVPGVVYMPGPITPEMVASLPLVENQLEFSAFKTSDGITWPRRILKRVQGHITEAWRLETVKINPKVDPRWFDASR